MSRLLEGLNPSQRAAVETLRGPLLVLAGAGSGKTRILTHRIGYLIESGTAMPGEIFAVTFTNKAAKEMKERVARLIEGSGIRVDDIWLSTFHSSGAKILRMYGERIGLDRGFSIFDDSDQLALIKDCMEQLQMSDKVVSPKAVMYKINALKNEARDPADFVADGIDYFEKKIEPLLHAYEAGLAKNNAVDFGDLLLLTYQLFSRDPAMLAAFQNRYTHFLVDEYQDTNGVQYELLKLLATKSRNICVVGDEDQSIYGWRGADIRNILDFEKDYPDAQVVKLEENYRSTAHIIRCANRVIANNSQRKSKNLFTNNEDGQAVEVHHLENDLEEARWVVRNIKKAIVDGQSPREVALFYRTHAQSRLFEDMLRGERLNYRIYGGLKFYDRAEIKDALAYLRLVVNPRDDLSLQRIINVPTRGIGKTSVDAAKNFAAASRMSLLEAVRSMSQGEGEVGAAARKKFAFFIDLYERIVAKKDAYDLRDYYAFLLDETGYTQSLQVENSIESVARLENLQELSSALAEYETRTAEPSLGGFLEEVALYTDADRAADDDEVVTLMTIHSAKGLEFELVHLVGMEEELFPNVKGDVFEDMEDDKVEEERRLCYVGMTRARKRLYLSSARIRRVFGITKVRRPSRFIDEMPQDEIIVKDHAPQTKNFRFGQGFGGGFEQEIGFESSYAPPTPKKDSFDEYFGDSYADPADDGYGIGVKVKHPDYGPGVVLKREGNRDSLKLSVKFDRVGVKKFLAKFAPLERL